jgi:hypothetical protein
VTTFESVSLQTGSPSGDALTADPMTETWDELASGLATAPETSRFPGEESISLEPPASSERFAAPGASLSLRNEIAAEFAAVSAPDGALRPGGVEFTTEQLDRIASRVVERLSDRVVRDIAWEVIPEIAENLIRQRIRELEEKIAREG